MIVFKAMGFCSDQQIMQMIGTEPLIMIKFAPSIEDCYAADVYTRTQALK